MNILSRLEQYLHFTDVEKEFASYVLEHPHEILDLSVDALAKKSFVSVSTVYRVINKLGLNGLNELKLRINADYESYLSEKKSVDYNYPFHKQNTPHQITISTGLTDPMLIELLFDNLDRYPDLHHVLPESLGNKEITYGWKNQNTLTFFKQADRFRQTI